MLREKNQMLRLKWSSSQHHNTLIFCLILRIKPPAFKVIVFESMCFFNQCGQYLYSDCTEIQVKSYHVPIKPVKMWLVTIVTTDTLRGPLINFRSPSSPASIYPSVLIYLFPATFLSCHFYTPSFTLQCSVIHPARLNRLHSFGVKALLCSSL